MPLNITEQNTLELIAARSKYNPITAKEIGERLKLSKRAVAEVVERLVNKWGIVIVGARQGKQGYYIPRNEEERQQGILPFASQTKKQLQRLEVLETADLDGYKQYLKEV
ncbi:HTH domain-containing protein [Streptococcus hyointestinalis]|nr:HTH domain-containing protein [Streptococcus hyointestinalis]